MAERRMFAKTIITSDAFLDMPATSRSLYMLLCVLADDDGFVNAPRSIMRMSGATEDDMKLLITKRFVLSFQSGVIVIKHWKIHNLIQKDRYKETKYLDEKAMLAIDENNAYTEACSEVYPSCIQAVSKVETQDRVGKDSLGKFSKDKGNNDSGESPTCQQIVDLYHSICKSYPSVRSLSEARKKAIKARLKTYSLKDIQTVFENAENSSFLKGRNDRNWSANFDWLIADKNMAKVLEGKYADKPRYGRKEPVPGWMQPSLGDAELEAIQRVLQEDVVTVENSPELAERAEKLKQRLGGA